MAWKGSALPFLNAWLVTCVSRVRVTGCSLAMYFFTARKVGLTPSTRAHSRMRSGLRFKNRISLSRSQTLLEPLPPKGCSPPVPLAGMSTSSSPSTSAGGVKGSGPGSSGFWKLTVWRSASVLVFLSSEPQPNANTVIATRATRAAAAMAAFPVVILGGRTVPFFGRPTVTP